VRKNPTEDRQGNRGIASSDSRSDSFSSRASAKDDIHASVEQGLRRRDENILRMAFDQFCVGNLLPRSSLPLALRQLRSPLKDDTIVEDVLKSLGHRAGEPIDLDQFRMLVDYPTPLERFLQALPLSKLLADALLDGSHQTEPLLLIASLTPKDIEQVTAGFLEGLKLLLAQHVRQCKRAVEQAARDRYEETPPRVQIIDSKFTLRPMSCGKVDDFHKGLSGRIGEIERGCIILCLCPVAGGSSS
jgi:hypothetical protein